MTNSAVLWRADVTAQVIAKGNGEYDLSGLADGDGSGAPGQGAGHSANGASLIVFYNDADAGNDRAVVLYESQISNQVSDPQLELPLDYAGGNALLEMHVADGQAPEGVMFIDITPGVPDGFGDDSPNGLTYGAIDGVARWGGLTVPSAGFPRQSSAFMWDIRSFDLGGSLGAPRRYAVNVDSLEQGSDCVSAVVELVSLPATPQAPVVSPNPYNFGDVPVNTTSAPQTFVLRNILTRPLQITDAASVTNSRTQIVADNCGTQTLEPGASCTVDVTCRPTVFVDNPPSALRFGYQLPGMTSTSSTAYAELDCDGVPSGPFARLSFSDPELPAKSPPVDFGSVAEGSGETVTRRFVIRSTGTEAVTASELTVSNAFTGYFSPGEEDCVGRSLAPGATCTLDVVFAPNPQTASPEAGPLPGSIFLGWVDPGSGLEGRITADLIAQVTTVAAPNLYLSPESRSFGESPVGEQTGTFQFLARNFGDTPLTLSTALAGANAADFVISSDECTGVTLAIDTTCAVRLRFLPQASGARSAELRVSGVTAGGVAVTPAPSALTGTGVGDTPPSAGRIVFGTPGSYEVGEAAGVFQVPVVRIDGDAGAVSVTVTTSNGSATTPGDYTAVSTVVNFADGTSGTLYVDIPVINDTLDEADETVTLTLSNPIGGATLGESSGTLTIVVDDEPPPLPQPGTLSFGNSAVAVAEDAGSATLTVRRSGGSDGAVSVRLATADGSAQAGADYTATTITLNWADGDAADKTVGIPVLDDAADEADESVVVPLSANTGGAVLGVASATLTIVDDDEVAPEPQPGTLSFGSAVVDVMEDAGTITLTVRRSGGSEGAASATVSTADGSALAGSDYATAVSTVAWADGDAADRSVTITVFDDDEAESNEVFTVRLSDAAGAALGSPATATVTIANDDVAPEEPEPQPGTLLLAAATARVNEGAGMITLTLWRSGGSDGAASVTVTTADGSARAGSDYAATTTTVNWADGDAADKTVNVLILDDAGDENAEVFTAALSAASGAALGAPAVLTVTIDDDDDPAPAPVQEGELTKGGGALAPVALLLLALFAAVRRSAAHLRRPLLAAALLFAPALSAAPFYVGVQGGIVESSLDSAALTDTLQSAGYAVSAELDDEETGWGIYGGWYFHPRAALELAYRDLGEYSASVSGDLSDGDGIVDAAADGFPGSGDALSAALRLDLPLFGRLSLRPSLGAFAWDSEVELQTDEGRYKTGSDGVGLLVGLGLDLRLGGGFSLGAGVDLLRPGHEGAQRAAYGRLEWRFGN